MAPYALRNRDCGYFKGFSGSSHYRELIFKSGFKSGFILQMQLLLQHKPALKSDGTGFRVPGDDLDSCANWDFYIVLKEPYSGSIATSFVSKAENSQ